MKKRVIMILVIPMLMLSSFITTQNAVATNTVTVIVDNRVISFPDAPAYVDANGRTQIPTRYIGEALGAKVEWESGAKRATFSLEIGDAERCVDFYIGSEVFYIKNAPNYYPERKIMDTAAVVENGRTYVPARYLAEALDATVQWESGSRTVYITSSSLVARPSEPKDESRYDGHGLMLAQYANEYYQQWYESLCISYEGDKVYLCYTVPDGIPDDAMFTVSLLCQRNNEGVRAGGYLWIYVTYEWVAGDREKGYDYLLPKIVSGDVRKELYYIPFEHISYANVYCELTTPREANTKAENNRYAQSSYTVHLNGDDLQQSELRRGASDWRRVRIEEHSVRIPIDGADIVKYQ